MSRDPAVMGTGPRPITSRSSARLPCSGIEIPSWRWAWGARNTGPSLVARQSSAAGIAYNGVCAERSVVMNPFERALRASALIFLLMVGLALPAGSAFADDYDYADTIAAFKRAGASADFFKSSYAYAVFPTIGKAGF